MFRLHLIDTGDDLFNFKYFTIFRLPVAKLPTPNTVFTYFIHNIYLSVYNLIPLRDNRNSLCSPLNGSSYVQ